MAKRPMPRHTARIPPSLLLGALVVALALPLAVVAVRSPVRYLPQAYIRDDVKTLETDEPNHPPSLEGSSFTAIKCTAGQACSYTFKANDRDLYDTLTLTVDFLPPELKLAECVTSQTLTGSKRLACDLDGQPLKPGNYKILASVTDGTNPPETKTFTLEVE